ncbi:hypothetical protein I4U23_011763 [Adineta vaga]|nr:hypothetical protein I4U23_011763 [Adineta vaga]
MSNCIWLFWLAIYCWCVIVLQIDGKKWVLIDSPSSKEDSSEYKVGHCRDHKKNGDETDVDCGGSKCAKCNDTMHCKNHYDCLSNYCKNKKCSPLESCDDNIKNQDEIDVDCGGRVCPKCEDAKYCRENCDCLSNACHNSTCVSAETCKDEIKNQDETDVDCGGSICPKCEDSKKCNSDCDCTRSFTCVNNTCVPKCTPECKNNGVCIAHNLCNCTAGFSGPTCDVQSVGLCHDNDTMGTVPILLVTFDKGSPQFSTSTPTQFNFTTTYKQRFKPTVEDGHFSFINSVYKHYQHAWHTNAVDHTGDNGGYMLLVNADFQPGEFYKGTVDNLCIGLRYEFSVYLANVLRRTDQIKPNVRFEVRSPSTGNRLLAQLRSGPIPVDKSLQWRKYGLSFTAPSSSVVLLMISDARGGAGNDIVIDDIALRVCSHEGTGFCPAIDQEND